MASATPNRGKDGKIISYRFRCCVGRDEQGRQKFATKTAKQPEGLTPAKEKKEMQTLADEWEKGIKAGKVPEKSQTFERFVNETWFPVFVADGTHKPTTVSFYHSMAERLIEYFGDKKLTAIKPIDVKKFYNYLRNEAISKDGKPLSAATIKHHADLLRNILNAAERYHFIERNPCHDIPTGERPHREKRKVDFLTPDQSKKFLADLERDAPLRWRCMMMLFINSGIRRGEACGLQWQDIDLDKRTLSIQRNVTVSSIKYAGGVNIGTPKTESAVRTLPLSAAVCDVLREWKADQTAGFGVTLLPRAYVFSQDTDPYKPMYPSSPTAWLKRFLSSHDLPDMSPHDLRHTCGALLIASGASVKVVQDTLGHADPETTLSFYTGTTTEMLRSAADNLADILKE
jgi:integrase